MFFEIIESRAFAWIFACIFVMLAFLFIRWIMQKILQCIPNKQSQPTLEEDCGNNNQPEETSTSRSDLNYLFIWMGKYAICDWPNKEQHISEKQSQLIWKENIENNNQPEQTTFPEAKSTMRDVLDYSGTWVDESDTFGETEHMLQCIPERQSQLMGKEGNDNNNTEQTTFPEETSVRSDDPNCVRIRMDKPITLEIETETVTPV